MITKEEFENILLRDDFIEYMSSLSKEEIEEKFGPMVSRMVGFEQKNIHHCYDLFGHTLHTVDSISKSNLSYEEIKKLKVAAFFHDIGKPDVARLNPKTGQQVFYGHAEKSQEVSNAILKELNYTDDEINKISFYIKHHDDFISYKKDIPSFLEHHEFIRKITPETVAEKMIENKYDFKKMGLNDDQIRYVCYALAHNEEPEFTTKDGVVEIKVDVEQVKSEMENYKREYIPTEDDYKLLAELCRADAKAQTELYVDENGRVLCSREDKVENVNTIEESIEKAFEIYEKVGLEQEVKKNLGAYKNAEVKLEENKKEKNELEEAMEEKGENPNIENPVRE